MRCKNQNALCINFKVYKTLQACKKMARKIEFSKQNSVLQNSQLCFQSIKNEKKKIVT